MKKRMAALLLVFALLSAVPAAAVEIPAWAVDGLCEAESLELLTARDLEHLDDAVTAEQVAAVCARVAEKLALLGGTGKQTALGRPGDLTRGGVLGALYDAASPLDETGAGMLPFLTGLRVLRGGGNGDYMLERPCTRLELFTFAQRLVLALYDREEAGTRGLLWRAVKGENTLYLFGTYHVDRGELYPLHSSVRAALAASQTLCLELDFGDTQGQQAFFSCYYYPQGDGLKNHLDRTTYRAAVEAMGAFGYEEAVVNSMKAWAVGNTLEVLASLDRTSGSSVMAPDAYLYSKAVCGGKPVEQVESYRFQAGVLDGLSEATQAAMVVGGLELLEEPTETDSLFTPWKQGDEAAFAAALGKDVPPTDGAGRELVEALYTGRDPAMAAWCADFLDGEGSRTALFAVGAGHMVGSTGVVAVLQDAGYTVEPVGP